MQSEKSKATITTKPATQGAGKQGKAVEAPAHHAAMQRRTVSAEEEKKEREARAAVMKKHHPHGGRDHAEQH